MMAWIIWTIFLHNTLGFSGPNCLSSQDVAPISYEILKHSHVNCAYFLTSPPIKCRQTISHLIVSMSEKEKMSTSMLLNSIDVFQNTTHDGCFYVTSAFDLHFVEELRESKALSSTKWLLFLDAGTPVEQIFNFPDIPWDCEFLIAQEGVVRQVHHSKLHHLANWSLDVGITWSIAPHEQRQINLKGAQLKVAVLPDDMYLRASRYKGNKPIEFSGHLIEIWREFERQMNFTSDFMMPDDKELGTFKDGTWSGIVGLLVSKKADVGLDEFIFTITRMSAVQYLPPIKNDKVMVFIKAPQFQDVTFTLLSPFDDRLWLTVLVSLMAIAFSMAMVCFLRDQDIVKQFTLYNTCFFILGSFLQQGHDVTVRTFYGRLVYLISYLTATVVCVAYTATLISFLNVQKLALPFTDFETLLEDGSYQLSAPVGSARLFYFQSSQDPLRRQVYKKLIEPNLKNMPQQDSEGLRNLCDCKTCGFITSYMMPEMVTKHLPCQIVGIPRAFYPLTSSIIIRKDSRFKRAFSNHIHNMKSSGILKRIYTKTYPPLKKEVMQMSPTVSLENVKSIIIVSVIGFSLSLAILAIEITCKQIEIRCKAVYSVFLTES